ncbi:MAG: threonine/serine exporter family protein [Clostridia bacterium]|nr:threonine/serine exporter family protein [Clostridia bacterium]MBQ4157457.1 threonine/serine exporter family protein [Clostridia bacterium]
MKEWVLPIVMASLGSLAFSMFFGVRSKKLIYSAIGGAINWGVYLVFMEIGVMEPLAYAIGAAAGTLYAEIVARIAKTPVTVFIITSVIPMVPGGSLYYTMLGLMQGNHEVFAEKGAYTLAAAGAMALGIFTATMLFRTTLALINGAKRIRH